MFGGFELGCSENNLLHHLKTLQTWGQRRRKQSLKEREGKPLWSGELLKGLEELESCGQAVSTASSPGSWPGFLQGALHACGNLFQTAAGRRRGRWGCVPAVRVEDRYVSLPNLFSSGHCHGNADKDFSKAGRRDLCLWCYFGHSGIASIPAGEN